MNARERFLKVFAHEIPDRVPRFVQHVKEDFFIKNEEKIFEYFYGEPVFNTSLDGPLALGFDACFMDLPSTVVGGSAELYLEEYGKTFRVGLNGQIKLLDQPTTFYQQGCFTSLERFEKVYATVKKVNNEEGIRKSQEYVESVQDRIFTVPSVEGLFDTIWMAMGFKTFAKEFRKRSKLYLEMIKGYFEISIGNAQGIIDAVGSRPGIICVKDDLAFKGRPMISPERWEQDFLPYYKQTAKLVHDAGMYFMLHSDGDVTDLVPSFIKAGFDGLQGWEGGADPKKVKEKFPEFVVIGFGDVSEVLPFGTPQKIEDHVKFLMDVLKPGGHYIFGPSTVIVKEMPFENVKIFMEAAKKYGNY
jgi:hypothetical protein